MMLILLGILDFMVGTVTGAVAMTYFQQRKEGSREDNAS